MNSILKPVVGSLMLALLSSTAMADVVINGDADFEASSENSAAISIGDGAQSWAGVNQLCGNVEIDGDLSMSARAKNSAAIAIGDGATAAVGSNIVGDGSCYRK